MHQGGKELLADFEELKRRLLTSAEAELKEQLWEVGDTADASDVEETTCLHGVVMWLIDYMFETISF